MTDCILIIGNLPIDFSSIESKLEDEYYDLLHLSDLNLAKSWLMQKSVDLILLGSDIEVGQALSFSSSCKQSNLTMHIPLIIFSTSTSEDDRIASFEAGCDDFFVNSVSELRILARIRSLLRIKAMFDEIRLRDKTWQEFGVISEEEYQVVTEVNGASIFIIDDNQQQSENIAGVLHELNLFADKIDNPENAVSQAILRPYDLIMVSTLMKNSDGLRLCSHIRNEPETRNTPILIIADQNNNELLIKALNMGIADYLAMPISNHELLIHVKTQVRKKKYHDTLISHYSQLANMAAIDHLTSLYNRRYFDSHLLSLMSKAIARLKHLSLLMIDIDDFKQVNDQYGHLVGDELLKTLARILHENIRVTDLVARFGGEEFIIALPMISAHQAQRVAERIRATIANNAFNSTLIGRKIPVTISIGVSFLQPTDDPGQFVARADAALYQAKRMGKNRVVIEE